MYRLYVLTFIALIAVSTIIYQTEAAVNCYDDTNPAGSSGNCNYCQRVVVTASSGSTAIRNCVPYCVPTSTNGRRKRLAVDEASVKRPVDKINIPGIGNIPIPGFGNGGGGSINVPGIGPINIPGISNIPGLGNGGGSINVPGVGPVNIPGLGSSGSAGTTVTCCQVDYCNGDSFASQGSNQIGRNAALSVQQRSSLALFASICAFIYFR